MVDQLALWRSSGFGRDVLEVWAVGAPGQEEAIDQVLEEMPEGFSEVLLVDTTDEDLSAWGVFGANVNDLFVVDPEGVIAYFTNVAVDPLTEPGNLDELDGVVRGLLE